MLTRLLYGITALLLAALLTGLAWQTERLRKAENRAVVATEKAGEYQRSLESSEALLAQLRKTQQTERRVLEDRAKAQAAALAKARKEANDLKQAIEANRDWADQPIPPDVARVLNQ